MSSRRLWVAIAVVAGGVALGVAVALPQRGTEIAIGLLLLVPIAFVARLWPEAVLLLFVVSGSFKSALPSFIDPTLVLGAVVGVLVGVRLLRGGVRRPPPGFWAFGLFALVVITSVLGQPSAYGLDKLARFGTLSVLAFVGGYLLLDEEAALRRFLIAVVAYGTGVAALGLLSGFSVGAARLTALQSNTIQYGRAASYAAAGAFVSVLHRRRAWTWATPVVAVCLLALAGSGSRGPALGLVLVCGALMLMRLATRGAARVALAGVAVGTAIAASGVWVLVPPQATARFALILQGNPGTSGAARLALYSTAVALLAAKPWLGWGLGSFSDYGGVYLYPHNALLEVGAEVGVVGLAPYLFALVSGVWDSVKLAIRVPSVGFDFLFAGVILGVVNAMVSGDLNDNRLLYALLGSAFGVAGAIDWKRVGEPT
jgi:O-antigen ligase